MDYLLVAASVGNTSQPAGTNAPLRGGNMGQLIVDELYGAQYESTYRGQSFVGANQAVVATALQTGLTATATGGLILSNPIGNTKNLVVRNVAIGVLVAQTSASIMGLMVASSPSVAIAGTLTVVASQPALSGGPAATGVLYSSASVTLQSTPILARVIGSLATGALTTQISSGIGPIDLQGGMILQPGSAMAFYGTGAGTASSLLFSFGWHEVPI